MRPLDLPARLAQPDRSATVLLDGGTATELEADGHVLADALWSARLLVDDPAAVRAVHQRFLAAGAEVVTTASYQLAATSLAAAGHDPADADALLHRSVTLARDAVEAFVADGGSTRDGSRPLVAASVGPHGAVLADGREYRGGYGLSRRELARFHAPRVAALVGAGADVLAIETVPSADELAALASVVAGVDVPVYASVTLGPDGTTTAEGQPLAAAFAPLLARDEVVAIGVNCCPPELVLPALRALQGTGHPLIAKPNVGRRWDARTRAWVDPGPPSRDVGTQGVDADTGGSDTEVVPDPRDWVSAGARLVGGCCGTGPDRIRELAARLGSYVGP